MKSTNRSAECTPQSHTQSPSARAADFRRAADHCAPEPRRRFFSRYFGHAGEADQHHFVGRVGELADSSWPCGSPLTAARSRPAWRRVRGRKDPAVTRVRAAPGGRGLALRGETVEQGDGRAAVRAAAERAAAAGPRAPPGARRAQLGQPRQLAALLPALDDGEPPRGRQDPPLSCACSRPCWSCSTCSARPAARADPGGHALGRPLDATFVSFLARSLRQERVLLLLTYRTDELIAARPAAAALRLDASTGRAGSSSRRSTAMS